MYVALPPYTTSVTQATHSSPIVDLILQSVLRFSPPQCNRHSSPAVVLYLLTRYQLQMEFQIEDKVEVIGHEVGYMDSYFPGKVISELNNDRYRVEYKTLWNVNLTGMLQETIHKDLIRPKAPKIVFKKYPKGDNVDVWWRGGWWIGGIIEVYGSYYGVKFDKYDGVWYFHKEKLRIHQESDGNPEYGFILKLSFILV